MPALDLFESRTGFLAARGVDVARIRFSTAFGRGLDYYTGFVFELHDPRRDTGQLVAGGRYDGLLSPAGQPSADPGGRALRSGSSGSPAAEAAHERAAHSRRAGQGPAAGERRGVLRPRRSALVKPRGARDYRGAIAGLDGVEVAYLSAAEIAEQLAQGAVHLGVTGEDLVREMIPQADDARGADRRARLRPCQCRGRGAAGLDRRAQHGRSRRRRDRVPPQARPQDAGRDQIREPHARASSPPHGIVDYRIVESAGATEGAPAAGTAELIVDITTTGATLAANGLKVVDDGMILRSQANLVAARRAALGRAGTRDSPASFSIASPRRRAPAPSARCARASPAATMPCWRRRKERFGIVDAVRRPDLLRHAHAALPAGPGLCARQFPARERRARRLRSPTSTTCSRATIRSMRSSRPGSAALSRRRAYPYVAGARPGAEHDEMRQREIDQETHQDRDQLRRQHRHEIGRDDQRRGVGDHAGDAGRQEGA